MTELKTLKDMFPNLESEVASKAYYVKSGEDIMAIRAEAIKWIKSFEYLPYPAPVIESICQEFKHFFNITEEDLKGEQK